MARLGAVVVGTGFGARVHVPALRAAGFDVVALVGRDREKTARRAARLEVPNATASLAEALALDGVDAVTIATPPDTHAPLVREACAAVRHVICEKPFAIDSGEATAMQDAAVRAGVVAFVGHEFRWAEDRVTLARAVASGAIGRPRQFSFVQYAPVVADPDAAVPDWWFDQSRGGGWLGASGSHVVDQVRVMLGEFASVSAALPTVSARGEGAEDSFVVRVTLANGVEGVLQQTAAAWTPEGAGVSVIAGTEGTVELVGGQVYLSDRAGRRVVPVPEDARLPATEAPSDDPRHRYTHLELGPYTRLCEAFRARIEGGDLTSAMPVPTFADGVAGMHVLDAIRRSAANDGALVPVAAGGEGLVAAFADRMERRDWVAFAELLDPDVVYEIPQSRERIRGRAKYVTFNAEFPGDWHIEPRVVIADEANGSLLFQWTLAGETSLAIAFFEFAAGRITHITDFWPEPYEPPPGREHLVERW